MNHVYNALWAENLKFRRSKLFPISIIVAFFFDLVMAFMMFVLKHPETARRYGLIAAKASIAGRADWPSYFLLLTMVVMAGGLIGFGFIASWIFGREYSDRTVKDLLALPAPRSAVVTAKFIAVGLWSVFLSLLVFAGGLLCGAVVGLDDWSIDVLAEGAARFAGTAGLTLVLSAVPALFASFGRGFLPPVGFIILSLLLAQISQLLGYAAYFPWAIPLVFSGAGGTDAGPLGAASYIIVLTVSAAGLAGTYAWWRLADQT